MKANKSKLRQAELFKSHPLTQAALPQMTTYHGEELLTYLRRYRIVYLKPNAGGKGLHIIRITRNRENTFTIENYNGNRRIVHSDIQLRQTVRRLQTNQTYVIQRGIHSVTKDGRPFDIRVFTQRLHGRWMVTGMVGKLGRKNAVVTNRHRGGRAVSVQYLFRHLLGMDDLTAKQTKRRLVELSLITSKIMQKGYPNHADLGIDIGIDQNRKLWLYEANITPGIMLFKQLKNQSMYEKILRVRQHRVGRTV